MKCEEVSKELIAYLDRRANSAERQEVEKHLESCAGCRARAEEFRKVWNVLEEIPVEEPSLGFDARIRQRIADEPRPSWFRWFVPQPRLALSMALLVALCVWVSRMPRENPATATIPVPAVATEQQQYQVIENLGVLENYDVLSKFDALSELPAPAEPAQHKETEKHDNSGGM
ncbi:MAG: zf-HC2 domain-containing protein [Candidatus Acidiferrales bacterium]